MTDQSNRQKKKHFCIYKRQKDESSFQENTLIFKFLQMIVLIFKHDFFVILKSIIIELEVSTT